MSQSFFSFFFFFYWIRAWPRNAALKCENIKWKQGRDGTEGWLSTEMCVCMVHTHIHKHTLWFYVPAHFGTSEASQVSGTTLVSQTWGTESKSQFSCRFSQKTQTFLCGGVGWGGGGKGCSPATTQSKRGPPTGSAITLLVHQSPYFCLFLYTVAFIQSDSTSACFQRGRLPSGLHLQPRRRRHFVCLVSLLDYLNYVYVWHPSAAGCVSACVFQQHTPHPPAPSNKQPVPVAVLSIHPPTSYYSSLVRTVKGSGVFETNLIHLSLLTILSWDFLVWPVRVWMDKILLLSCWPC